MEGFMCTYHALDSRQHRKGLTLAPEIPLTCLGCPLSAAGSFELRCRCERDGLLQRLPVCKFEQFDASCMMGSFCCLVLAGEAGAGVLSVTICIGQECRGVHSQPAHQAVQPHPPWPPPHARGGLQSSKGVLYVADAAWHALINDQAKAPPLASEVEGGACILPFVA